MAYKSVEDEIHAVLNEMAREYADKVLSDKRDMMTVKEVADVLGTSERFIYNLISKERKLFAFKLGKKVVIPKESIRDYLTQNYV